jgi:hypothetical protein
MRRYADRSRSHQDNLEQGLDMEVVKLRTTIATKTNKRSFLGVRGRKRIERG